FAEPARRICCRVCRKDACLCAGSTSRVLRFSHHSQDCPGSRTRALSLVVVDFSCHQEHAVSDEEVPKAMTGAIFKKAIPRRTFIRGLGVTLGLPLLDAMNPALAAPEKPVKRFSIVYVPNGRIMERWTPATEGTDFALPLLLEPFAPFRSRLLIITGLNL